MRFCLCMLFVVLIGFGSAAIQAADSTADSEARLRETVTYLASDELQGRGVGTAGIDKAADYIADQFSRLGLRTDLYNGTPFQEFEMTLAGELGPGDQNRLSFVGPKEASGQTKP